MSHNDKQSSASSIADTIQKIQSAIGELMPDAIGDEIKQQLASIVSAAITDLHLVSREEFDIQNAVLQKTRQKITHLEKTLDTLESQFNKD